MPGRSRITRRQVLAGGAAAGVLVAFGGDKALARGLPRLPRLASNPFTLGVASGDPLPNGVVLWTRLAPDPLTADGGLAGAGNLEVGWHSTFVNDVHPDFRDPASPVVATEILAPAVTSNGGSPVYGPYYGPMIQFNPHIKFFEGDRKGYVRCAVDRHLLQADLRYVERVGMHRAPIETFASFVVEDGHPGALPA